MAADDQDQDQQDQQDQSGQQDQDTGDQDAGDQQDDSQKSGEGATDKKSDAGDGDAPVRPDNLPDEFWNETEGVMLPDLLTKFGELAGAQAERDVDAQGVPEGPDGYALPDVEQLDLPEGAEFEFDEKHPLLGPAREFAHAANLTQENFSGLVGLYIRGQVLENTQLSEQAAAEKEKLGEKADDRVMAVMTALTSRVGKDAAAALQGMMFTSQQVEAFEKLIRGTKAPGFNSKTEQRDTSRGWDENATPDQKLAIAHRNAERKRA